MPAHSHATIYPFRSPLPQLHNWLRPSTISQWWCTSARLGVQSRTHRAPNLLFILNSLHIFAHSQAQNNITLFRSTETESCVKLDDQLSCARKGLTRACSESQLLNFWAKMISLKQNHTHKNWAAFYTVARNFYLPVNNFPTSHSRIGAFDFTFMGACFSNVTQAKRNCKERGEKKLLSVLMNLEMAQI